MRMFVDPRAVYLYPKTTLSTINANTLVASNGGVGGTGAAGGVVDKAVLEVLVLVCLLVVIHRQLLRGIL
ncbi:hypothetical protein [Glaciecola sp. 33A]|jgi:hypothetical protein|uniref:hypothetical protein n=1 Tax=Glaciecola sp. 33A TaxID=2057807 RepID=UPI000C329E6C|nr:hypothetical protein [Glaciecola sp. 33A]